MQVWEQSSVHKYSNVPLIPLRTDRSRPRNQTKDPAKQQESVGEKYPLSDSPSTSLLPPQKQKCVNEVVNNTDLLRIDALVFRVWLSIKRLFTVAVG